MRPKKDLDPLHLGKAPKRPDQHPNWTFTPKTTPEAVGLVKSPSRW